MASVSARKERKHVEMADLARQKGITGGQDINRLHRARRNGAWLSAVPHRLNGTELSRDEFQDNLRHRYGMMSQDIPTTCDGCDKRFLIEHALSCPKGDLVLVRHDDATKEWGALGDHSLVP